MPEGPTTEEELHFPTDPEKFMFQSQVSVPRCGVGSAGGHAIEIQAEGEGGIHGEADGHLSSDPHVVTIGLLSQDTPGGRIGFAAKIPRRESQVDSESQMRFLCHEGRGGTDGEYQGGKFQDSHD